MLRRNFFCSAARALPFEGEGRNIGARPQVKNLPHDREPTKERENNQRLTLALGFGLPKAAAIRIDPAQERLLPTFHVVTHLPSLPQLSACPSIAAA